MECVDGCCFRFRYEVYRSIFFGQVECLFVGLFGFVFCKIILNGGYSDYVFEWCGFDDGFVEFFFEGVYEMFVKEVDEVGDEVKSRVVFVGMF